MTRSLARLLYARYVSSPSPHIGTLGEKPLHASLKRWYAQPGDRIEAAVDRFVIDLIRGDVLIEIQTRGFSSMKRKVRDLLAQGHHLRIVHPIAIDRWIVKVDDEGEVIGRRRSPRHGAPTDVFAELVAFPEFIGHPRFGIDLVMTLEDEIRRHTPGASWRRKGWSVVERRLLDVVDTHVLAVTDDFARMLPATLPDPFTTADLATALARPRRSAQQMTYCLRNAGVITAIGKSANSVQYERIE